MTLADRIFEGMRNDIVLGVYPVHSRLPSERDLVEKYNASRFAVREAISRLIQSGFVITQPQSGTYVVDFVHEGSIETLVQVLRIRRTIDAETMKSLMQFRLQTESQAAVDAARHIQDSDIEYLTDILRRKRENGASVEKLVEADYLFHHRIILLSGNRITQLIFKSFQPVYMFFTEFFYSLDDAAASSLRLNEKLLRALTVRDAAGAGKAMTEILKNGERKVLAAIKRTGSKELYLPPNHLSL
jgi:DNA-binding FadR family transcriptional regulator